MYKSNIEWTEFTWNPTTGCDKVSRGCKNCYAETISKRLQQEGNSKYRAGFQLAMHANSLRQPYKLSQPTVVFVNSMSDTFHEKVSTSFLLQMFRVMNETPQHTYQILTKRTERLLELQSHLNWTPNIWMGVSVEDDRVLYRIDDLKQVGAAVKFLSIEPLIGAIPNLNLEGIDWVIVGGESGSGNLRPMKEEWVQDILQQCDAQQVKFFFKQWGGVNKKIAGRTLNGRTYDDMPETTR